MFFRCDTVGVTHAFDLFAPTLPLVHKLHTGRFYRATPRWPAVPALPERRSWPRCAACVARSFHPTR